MWIQPDARGTGIEAAVLAELERQAHALGCTSVRLDTNKTLTTAAELYRRSGYCGIAGYNDNPDADLWFEKQVAT